MPDRAFWRRTGRIAPAILGLLMLAPVPLGAGTTGRLTGRVLDAEGEPAVAVTVTLTGTRLGAYTTDQGKYQILNIPAGTYEVRFARMGFDTKVVQGVIVSADQTTVQDAVLGEVTLRTEEVVITAERPPVELELTSTKATVTTEQMESLPIQELQDVVDLQAGVVDGHFRGGRKEEVQYQVDGVSVNNAFDNSNPLRLDRSLLQEVQVISGTFDAEYGQAMSGVVNAVLKQGTEDFRWSGEAYGGGYYITSDRLLDDKLQPMNLGSLQFTVSGPLLLDTVFLLSGRGYVWEDYVRGYNYFVPTDSSDFENKVFVATGDSTAVGLGRSSEWSGAVKLTNSSIPNAKLNYQAIFNVIDERRTNFAFRYNPEGASLQETFSISHGLDWNHTLGATSYFDLSFRQNYFDYQDSRYDDLYDPRYDAAGPPVSDLAYEEGAFVQGVDFTRYVQTTNTLLAKGAYVNQLTPITQMKLGGEIQFPAVEFGNAGYLTYTTVEGVQTLVRHVDDPPDYPGVRRYNPVIGAAFAQGVVEDPNLTVRFGARMDFFDARSVIPGDLSNPANSIAGAPVAEPVGTTAKLKVSPRLGIAHPIEGRAAIHFAYGHFYQYPAIGQIFNNADYSVLSELQAGGISYGVMGNPDVEPEKTVQYELGYKHALTDDIGIDLTVFYKDIRNLLGVEFISTYNDAEYARLTNVDFGDAVGVIIAFDHRRLGPVELSFDYTLQQALGNSSDPRETATRASAGEDPRPRLAYFVWDQRHTFNLTASVRKTRDYNASMVLRAVSGQPYTPILEAGFGSGLEVNSGRKPPGLLIDLRGEKTVRTGGPDLRFFARVFNLLDSRFFNGPVFNSTGSPYYSRFPETDAVALGDPTRYYAPRRIEFGLAVGM